MLTRQRLGSERHRHEERRDFKRGFTLLEISLYATLALLLGMPLVSMVLVSSRSTADNDTINRVTERNRTALFRIEKELRRAIQGTVQVADYGRGLVFSTPVGFDGTALVPGPTLSFSLQPSGEGSSYYKDPYYQDPYYRDPYTQDPYYTQPYYPDGGYDYAGGGYVAEADLVLYNSNTGESTTIASSIDMNSSGFMLNGEGVTITLTHVGTLGTRGHFQVSRSMTVYPRN